MKRMSFQLFGSSACRAARASRRKRIAALAVVPLAALAATGSITPTSAEPGGLSGNWRGSGWVSFSNGAKEKARCRASYSRYSADAYKVVATCATSSGKARQTATVYKVTSSRYRGSFYNTDYNVRGTIRVIVNGGSQQVSLNGDGASASLRLSRR
jgi:hypothetical protein